MKEYHLTGQITVSCYTIVLANSRKEAEEIAMNRDVTLTGQERNPEEIWVIEDTDGGIFGIEED
jgi:hypothetical protein